MSTEKVFECSCGCRDIRLIENRVTEYDARLDKFNNPLNFYMKENRTHYYKCTRCDRTGDKENFIKDKHYPIVRLNKHDIFKLDPEFSKIVTDEEMGVIVDRMANEIMKNVYWGALINAIKYVKEIENVKG